MRGLPFDLPAGSSMQCKPGQPFLASRPPLCRMAEVVLSRAPKQYLLIYFKSALDSWYKLGGAHRLTQEVFNAFLHRIDAWDRRYAPTDVYDRQGRVRLLQAFL